MNRLFKIPIYDNCEVRLVVTKDIRQEHKKYQHLFGPINHDESVHFDGLVDYRGTKFLICFTPESSKKITTIAHEVFHLTHRILEAYNCNFNPNNHEPAAYLHEYLMNLVTNALKKK